MKGQHSNQRRRGGALRRSAEAGKNSTGRRYMMRKAGAALAVLGAGILGLPWVIGVASASGTTGFNVGSPITISSTSEACNSYLVGASTPKVNIAATSGVFQAGSTIAYAVSLDPAATATYNTRVCVATADINGNYVATLGEAEFDSIPVPPDGGGFNFTYQLPSLGTIGNNPGQAYYICSVAKTQESVNGGGADRKTAPDCNVIATPTLQITKTADTSPVTPGSPIGFTITASNTGSGDATGYSLTDDLPTTLGLTGGWSLGSTTGTNGCSITGNTLTCTGNSGTLAAGASFSVDVINSGGANATGTVNNTATESASNASPAQASASVQVNAPNITVAKTAIASPVDVDQSLGFDITASNAGPGDAHGFALTDSLPTALGVSGWHENVTSGTGDCTIASGVLTCNGSSGTLAAGTSFTVEITSAGATSGGTIQNTASESATGTGTISASASVVVNAPDLQIAKTAVASPVDTGASVGFDITVKNAGNGDANDFLLTDTLPSGLGLGTWSATVTSGTGNCGISSGVLNCYGDNASSPGLLKAGESFTVKVTNPGATSTGSVDNTATASATGNSPVSSSASVLVQTAPAPDLQITKVADQTSVTPGSAIGFTITATNSGNANATDFALTDTLPTNLGLSNWSVESQSASAGCTIASPSEVLTCTGSPAGTLAAGASFSVHVVNASGATGTGTVDNTASESATGIGPLTASASVEVVAPNISITKTALGSSVDVGQALGFNITASNPGPGDAHGFTLTDDLPTTQGLSGTWTETETSGTGNCTIASDVLTCTGNPAGTLAVGDSFTVKVTSTGATSAGTVTNTASESATGTGTLQASASVVVVAPNLQVTKTPIASPVTVGAPLGFNITVSNTGAGDATGFTLTDDLPTTQGLSGTWSDSVTSGTGNCSITGDVLTCTGNPAGTLTAGDSFTVKVTSTGATSAGTVDNTAVASASNAPDQSGSGSVQVNAPTLQVTKSAIASPVGVDTPLGFNITATNTGAGDATGFALTDNLPTSQGLSGTWSATVTAGTSSCSITLNVLSCTGNPTGTLAAGASFTVRVTSTGATSAGTVDNTATASASNAPNASSSASVDVTAPAPPPATGDIALAKNGPSLAHVGDTVTYTLTVTNPGTVNLVSVTVTDRVCSAAPVLGSENPNHATTLDPGDVWTYTCSHVVTANDADPLVNTATVTGVDPNGATQTATASHSVTIIHPSVAITKTASPTSGTPGTAVTYTYVVTNTGDTTLAPVVVTDNVLGAVATIASLAPSASTTVSKTSAIGTTAITNIGTATGTDPLGATVTATASATTAPHANAAVTAPSSSTTTTPSTTVHPATITPAATPKAALAFTGADVSKSLITGGVALGLGALLILGARRRRDEE